MLGTFAGAKPRTTDEATLEENPDDGQCVVCTAPADGVDAAREGNPPVCSVCAKIRADGGNSDSNIEIDCLRYDSDDTLHFEVSGDSTVFTEYGERKTVLCGATLPGTGLAVRRSRIVDEGRRENLCTSCLSRLSDLDVTVPGIAPDGEVKR